VTARRAAPGKRWSATSTVAELSGGRVQVRWRLDGKNRKKTFSGPTAAADAQALRNRLVVAYTDDWPADDRYLPVPPTALPTVEAVASLELPTVAVAETVDIVSVCDWYLHRMRTTVKRRGGDPRSDKTIHCAESTLAFIAANATYPACDPRLEQVGADVGDPIRFGDGGIDIHDITRLIDIRSRTNMRTRAANDRRLARWAQAIEEEETAAEREGREVVIPDAPELKPEIVSARTIEAFCNQLKALLVAAHLHQIIDTPAWTPACDDLTITAATTSYTTRTLPNRDQIAALVHTMTTHRRATRRPGPTGERYAAMVDVIGTAALREEELAAARLSWLHLDGPRPYIEVAWSEVYARGEHGRERIQVPLKHRSSDETRIVWIDDRLADVLRTHVDRFVADPDPDSADDHERDPHLFTTHRGNSIDFSNWVNHWWKPVVASTFTHPNDQHLAGLGFNRLRAAAITAWLTDGCTLDYCARQAGNTQAVIEKHYKGVITEVAANGIGDQAA
jgi:hypothetical protein